MHDWIDNMLTELQYVASHFNPQSYPQEAQITCINEDEL
jgi:hypothetical protein